MRKATLFLPLLVSLALTGQSKLDEADRLLQQGRQEINQGNFAAAEADLTTVLGQAKLSQDLRHQILADEAFSDLKERQSDVEGAEQWLSRAVDSLGQPVDQSFRSQPLLILQAFYSRHHLFAKEVEVLNRIIALWSSAVGPDSMGVAHYKDVLGQAHFQMGDSTEAESDLRSAISIYDKAGPSFSDAADYAKRNLLKVLMKEDKRDEVRQLVPSMHPDPPKKEHPDALPQLIAKSVAQYPLTAGKSKWKLSGSVVITLEIDETGHPQNLRVVEPLGLGFDENAVAAVSTWKFKPATKGGVPIAANAKVEVNFEVLPGSSSPLPSAPAE